MGLLALVGTYKGLQLESLWHSADEVEGATAKKEKEPGIIKLQICSVPRLSPYTRKSFRALYSVSITPIPSFRISSNLKHHSCTRTVTQAVPGTAYEKWGICHRGRLLKSGGSGGVWDGWK